MSARQPSSVRPRRAMPTSSGRRAARPPATRPVHPLGEEAITAANLGESPLFGHYRQHAPVDAARLLRELRQYEADLASYLAAEQAGLRFRTDNAELAQRRRRAGRRGVRVWGGGDEIP